MARIRYIKPEFFEDEKIGSISLIARHLYIALFCHLDRSGVIQYSPKLFKAKAFAFDDSITSKDVEKAIGELLKIGRFQKFDYQGQEFLFCPTFSKHQLFHQNERSKFPLSKEEIEALVKHRTCTVLVPFQHAKELVIGNGELVTGNGELNSFQGEKNSHQDLGRFLGAYRKAYKERYRGVNLHVDNVTAKKIKDFLKVTPIEKAISMIQIYCQMDGSKGWFKTKGHDFETFKQNISLVNIAMSQGSEAGKPKTIAEILAEEERENAAARI